MRFFSLYSDRRAPLEIFLSSFTPQCAKQSTDASRESGRKYIYKLLELISDHDHWESGPELLWNSNLQHNPKLDDQQTSFEVAETNMIKHRSLARHWTCQRKERFRSSIHSRTLQARQKAEIAQYNCKEVNRERTNIKGISNIQIQVIQFFQYFRNLTNTLLK